MKTIKLAAITFALGATAAFGEHTPLLPVANPHGGYNFLHRAGDRPTIALSVSGRGTQTSSRDYRMSSVRATEQVHPNGPQTFLYRRD